MTTKTVLNIITDYIEKFIEQDNTHTQISIHHKGKYFGKEFTYDTIDISIVRHNDNDMLEVCYGKIEIVDDINNIVKQIMEFENGTKKFTKLNNQ